MRYGGSEPSLCNLVVLGSLLGKPLKEDGKKHSMAESSSLPVKIVYSARRGKRCIDFRVRPGGRAVWYS